VRFSRQNRAEGTRVELWYETIDGRWQIMTGHIPTRQNASLTRRLAALARTGHLMRYKTSFGVWGYKNGTELDWNAKLFSNQR
jgi:hypothetical protein